MAERPILPRRSMVSAMLERPRTTTVVVLAIVGENTSTYSTVVAQHVTEYTE